MSLLYISLNWLCNVECVVSIWIISLANMGKSHVDMCSRDTFYFCVFLKTIAQIDEGIHLHNCHVQFIAYLRSMGLYQQT